MGQAESVGPSSDEVDILRATTHFTSKEIDDWYVKFNQDYPEGYISKTGFVAMYNHLFTQGDAAAMAERVFNAQDANGDERVDFVEFMTTLSVATKGSVEEKLHWSFKMYDADGDGAITRDEARDMFMAIFMMRGTKDPEALAEDAVEELFLHLDKNQDNMISQMEFMVAAKHSKTIVRLLQGV